MSEYSEKTLTESWKDKRYEEDLTKLYFNATRDLRMAHSMPNLGYIRNAYSAVREFCEATVYSKKHLTLYQANVKPILEAAQLILYGQPNDMSVVSVSVDYEVRLRMIRGQMEIENGVNLLNQLSEILFLVKQWAYDQGLLLSKPIDRKYGTDAIEDNMKM